MILGIINAANGKEEKLPLIGQFADKFKFWTRNPQKCGFFDT
jgi:hypothetical protein